MTRTTHELLEVAARHNAPNYAPAPVIFDHGEGVYLVDRDGKRYLDFMAGIAVCSLGYGHPRLIRAIQRQMDRLFHASNLFYTAEQIELLERLSEITFGDRAFLGNSGTEINEAAIKLVRRYQYKRTGGSNKSEILTFERSFHGRTLAAVTATGQPRYHEGFEPLVPGFVYAPYNDLERAREMIGEQTAAVFIEPIQGEGGLRPATAEFLQGLREACDAHGALLVFDEVQTGIGRTGEMFAYEHFGTTPDVLTLAKGLGGGMPVGAMIATDEVFSAFERGTHGSTFGGNPLASVAALAVLDTIAQEELLPRVRRTGELLLQGMRELAERYDVIRDVRGIGLMVGAECGEVAPRIVDLAREEGLIISTAGGTALRLVPPLIIEPEHVEEAIARLGRALERVTAP